MNDSTTSRTLLPLEELLQRQRSAFRLSPYPPVSHRQNALNCLHRLLSKHEDEIAAAIKADFGHRSIHETKLLELFPSLECVRHAKRRVGKWMRPEKKAVSPWFLPGRAKVMKQPLGVVGIIVPWNYPIYLAVGPLVSALAAGNRVMIKMSEMTPNIGRLFASLMERYFDTDQIAVVNGGVDVAKAFAALPFDHLIFTGSTAVGRQVMESAAKNLTPVTLELGGKSPVIIAPDFPVDIAASRILFGKCVNAGQTCIAPDYVLLHEAQLAPFVESAKHEVERLYPKLVANPDYSAIINEHHYERLTGYLDDAHFHGAEIISLGTSSSVERKFAPTLVINAHEKMTLMQEEIFGPILPVLVYRQLSDALDYVVERPRPLAFYYFDYDAERIDYMLKQTITGGVSINDTIFHIAQEELPFGGIGASGMGHYHGIEGFNALSKRKGVFIQSSFNGIFLLKPPFGKRVERLLKFMLR